MPISVTRNGRHGALCPGAGEMAATVAPSTAISSDSSSRPRTAPSLSDLRRFTRDLMAQMERDLETTLGWVAIDHHDTGHPHRCCHPRATTSPTANELTPLPAQPHPRLAAVGELELAPELRRFRL